MNNQQEEILKWFKFDHLRSESARKVSSGFAQLAHSIVSICAPGPERTVALRKLLEAKDAAVRAKMEEEALG